MMSPYICFLIFIDFQKYLWWTKLSFPRLYLGNLALGITGIV